MIVVKDAMVLIHLAKADLLEKSCDYFGAVAIPQKVKDEVVKGEYPDAIVIKTFIEQGKIKVKKVIDKQLIAKANEYNIQRGEAEAVALYWELKADYLATDDENVRKKRDLLKLSLLGTPAIILRLYQNKKIKKERAQEAIRILRKIGWFHQVMWDKIQMEVEQNE